MKKVLIASPYFAPENSTASIRFTKIAKYLQRMGYDVTVLCTQMNVQWIVDKTLQKDLEDIKKVVRIKYPNLLYYGVKRFLGEESKQINLSKNTTVKQDKAESNEKAKVWKDALISGYAYFCSILLGKRFIKYIKKQNEFYDIVITTYAPISGNVLGDYMKKHHFCSIWIEDFRDPLTLYRKKNILNSIMHFYGVRLMRRPDYITTISKGVAIKLIEEAGKYHVKIKDKIRIIFNGYDPEDLRVLKDMDFEHDKLIITYCGTLQEVGGRLKHDISPMLEVLSDLIVQGKMDKNFVEIRCAGDCEDVFFRYATKYNLIDLVHSCGRVSRDQSLKLQKESDIILVPVWNNKGDTGIISGKFFETLLVQRNVLAVITGNQPNSELAEMIRQIQCGFAYEEINGNKCNMNELKEWMLKKYNEKKTIGQLEYSSNMERKKYSHPYLAKKFEKLFEINLNP